MPQIRHFENDNQLSINFETALSGYPMVVTSSYGKGSFCVLAVPDDFADLYRLPQNVLSQIRSLLAREMFVTLDAPHHVSLFAYDNRTFIVQNYQAQEVSARVSVPNATQVRDLLTGQTVTATQGAAMGFGAGARGRGAVSGGRTFETPVPAHSFRVFAAE
jgi:hypothetical protein